MKSEPHDALCYRCLHRGHIPGNCHTKCTHPDVKDRSKMRIKGNEQGIKGGWFAWPYNFDPVWLENCDGFESTEKETNDEQD